MKTNISIWNRAIRMIIGILAILGSILFFTQLNLWVFILGVILLLTGIIGFCPIDYYFHMKQRR